MENSSSSSERKGSPFKLPNLQSSDQYSSFKSNDQSLDNSWKQESQVIMLPERSKMKKIQQAMEKVVQPKEIERR